MARIFLERRDLGDDIRRLLNQLDPDGPDASGEYTPPCDVIERPDGLDVVIDLPGVAADAVTVVFAHSAIVVTGRKRPSGCAHSQAAFHLAERTFGQFARIVPITGAYDAGRAIATLRHGELRVHLPRIDDRRGREIRVPIRED